MHAQENFGSYLNRIFFNVFSSNPDTSIHSFLKEYVPILLHPLQNSSKWTAYPTKDIIVPVIKTHSYFFNKHPFFDVHIKQGELKIYTTVYDYEKYHDAIGIKDVRVILEFEKSNEAINLFEKLRKDLGALGQEETYYEDKFKRFSKVYGHEIMYNIPCGVRIHLETKKGIGSLYQLSLSIN
jgi:hypothetical protein